MKKKKLKNLTREDILKTPDMPIGQRADDLPEDKEFIENFMRTRRILYKAAEKLCDDGIKGPKFIRRALEVLKTTGLTINEYNHLSPIKEIEVLQAAAAMKRQQRADASGQKKEPLLKVSPPMTKGRMMRALKIKSYAIFRTFCITHPVISISGNRQLWQMQLDTLSEKERQAVEKA